ncbi:CusA/CzcA family heavy metal efflux RND transporter [Nannocystis sp. SCPEA4]|uniref:efflux RND transporter permease subunit n=1 Tax=Nannocystis sp. SCPEA4 TaxID=2996787 RepID=UPI00226DAFEA|nr:CusA/CzcA family heavy metal efflux RND transporter [Nannocystis sp. SCPEA4]MCY1058605.1 CusA/CzcA family heavy metal efflux RND transporter [Nannocystis sp. SCPEA4]
MLTRLPTLALRFPLAVLFLAAVWIAVGAYALATLKIEAYPDVSDTQVVVVTKFPGYAAEEVEQLVTVPIERALGSVPHVIGRRSRTIFGLSVVELTFDDVIGDLVARQVVLEKLRDADLPPGVSSSLGPMSTAIGEMFRYRLVSDTLTVMELRTLQDWVVAPRLLQAPGVADVVTFGGEVRQYQVELDPLALEKYHLSIEDISSAIEDNNANAGGGVIDNGQQSIAVRSVGQLQSAEDIESTLVGASGGVPIFVRDVATVRIGAAPPTGIFGIDEIQGAVEGLVLMRRWENPSEVLAGIHARVDALNAGEELEGARIVGFYDRSELVGHTLRTVSRTLAEGVTIVVLVLVFLLGSVRAALLTALTIPLSLLFAFVCMKLAGIPANLLSLGALDFGIIVDGTLVMVEALVHRLQRRPDPRAPATTEELGEAACGAARPIVFSLAIIIAAYLPLFMLQRVERRLFTPMAFTVSTALLGSLLLCLTLTPVLASYLFRRGVRIRDSRVMTAIGRGYEWTIRRLVRGPRRVVTAAALITVVALVLLGRRVGTEFLPQLDEGSIWIRCQLPRGLSLFKSAEIASTIRALVLQSPEVRFVSSQTGRNDSGTDPYGPNRNEFLVGLQPYETWPKGKVKADLVETLATRLRAAIPGGTFSFTQPIIDNATEAATGSSADLAIIIRGPELDELRRLAVQSREVVAGIAGAADTAIEQEAAQEQLRLRLRRADMARYGVDVSDVQQLVSLAIGGRPIDTVYEGSRRFSVALRFIPAARASGEAIGRLLITPRRGGRVPLAEVADIEVVEGATIIARRENHRQVTVRTNIRGRDQGSFVAEAQRRLGAALQLPPGYHLEWGGQFENLDRARRRLVVILPLTLGIIVSLLFFAFRSLRWALLVLACVPFSLVGGVFALWLRGIHLSVSAAVGMVSLFGVAVMSGVLLVESIRTAEAGDGEGDAAELAVRGATRAVRPLLLMVLVALLGMVPAARATGIGSDVQRPLATVVVGGLISTLFLTLLVLPCAASLVRPGRERAPPRG